MFEFKPNEEISKSNTLKEHQIMEERNEREQEISESFNILLQQEVPNVSQNDFDIILNQYQEEAKKGDIHKQFNLGWIYDKGYGVPVDEVEAVKWYTLAAQAGHSIAQFNLIVMSLDDRRSIKNINLAVEYAKKIVLQKAMPEARVLLGYLHEIGVGFPQKFETAVQLYRQASAEECAEAYYRLSLCYRYGKGVEKDIYFEQHWLDKAIQKEHPGALVKMGIKLEKEANSKKSKKLYSEACSYFEKAALKNDPVALHKLGERCNDHELDDWRHRDDKKAKFFFEKSAQQNYAPAQLALGKLFQANKYGQNLPESKRIANRELAVKCLRNVASYGNPEAQEMLAEILLFEFGKLSTEEIQKEGSQWLYKALDQGYGNNTLAKLKGAKKKGELEEVKISDLEERYKLGLEKRYKQGYTIKDLKRQLQPKNNTLFFLTFPIVEPEITLLSVVEKDQYDIYQAYITIPGLNIARINTKALIMALEKAHFKFAKKILTLQADLHINEMNEKSLTPLELAIGASQSELVALILKRQNLNINLNHPLLQAVKEHEEQIVSLLLSVPMLDINATQAPGTETALWIAAKNGNVQIVNILLRHDDINVDYRCNKLTVDELKLHEKDKKIKLTAQEIAQDYGHEDIANMIQEYKKIKVFKERENATKHRQALKKVTSVHPEYTNPDPTHFFPDENNLIIRLQVLEKEVQLLKEQSQKQFDAQMLQHQKNNQLITMQLDELFVLFKSFLSVSKEEGKDESRKKLKALFEKSENK